MNKKKESPQEATPEAPPLTEKEKANLLAEKVFSTYKTLVSPQKSFNRDIFLRAFGIALGHFDDLASRDYRIRQLEPLVSNLHEDARKSIKEISANDSSPIEKVLVPASPEYRAKKLAELDAMFAQKTSSVTEPKVVPDIRLSLAEARKVARDDRRDDEIPDL